MAVDGPMGKDDVGLLGLDQFPNSVVLISRNLGAPVDLAREGGASLEDLAGFLGFGRANRSSLVMRLAWNSSLAAGQIENGHGVAVVDVASDCAATAGFGIVGVSSCDQHLQAARFVLL